MNRRAEIRRWSMRFFQSAVAFFIGFLGEAPVGACLSPAPVSFSGVSDQSLNLHWLTACSSGTIQYSEIDDDSGFASPFSQSSLGPPVVFGSSVSLVPNTRYFARVSTAPSMGNSVPLGSTRTLAALPTPLPIAVLSATQLQGAWTAGPNPPGTAYTVQISSDGFLSVLDSSATSGAAMTFGGLAPDQPHALRVRALNDDGVPTAFVSLGTASTAAHPPGIPVTPFSLVSAQGFRLNWTAGAGGGNPPTTLYEAEVSTDAGFLSVLERISTPELQADVDTLSPGTSYFARVRAVNRDSLPTGFVLLGSTVTPLLNPADVPVSLQSADANAAVFVDAGTFPADFLLTMSTDPIGTPLASTSVPAAVAEAEEKTETSSAVTRTRVPDAWVEIRAEDAGGGLLDPVETANPLVRLRYPSTDGVVVDASTGAPVRADTLSVYRLNEDKGLWVRLPSSRVDTTAREVTAATPLLGVFALLGQMETRLEPAFAYPVPFRAARGDTTITFGDLAQRVTIRVFTAAGRWVKTLEETDGDGELEWDVTDADGSPLPSGVYFFLMESSTDKKRGKIVVIR